MRLFSSIFNITDEQAMWRVQMHDDSQAFAQLLARWEGPIRRLCARMVLDEHKAEDLTQEAFTRIYARRKEYQHGAKFSTFIWRVAVNLCLDEIRRVKRRRELSLLPRRSDQDEPAGWEEIPSQSGGPDDAAIAEEQAAMVREAVLHLPEHYRSVVVLRHYEGLRFREIAEVLEIPEGTVKSRMAEALGLLSRALKKAVRNESAVPGKDPGSRKEVFAI